MNRFRFVQFGIPVMALGLVFGACGENEAAGPTATPTQPAVETPAGTPTSPTTTPEPTPANPPPTDGTVDPLGPGQTEDWSVKPWPTDPATGVALLKEVRIGVHPEEGGWERIVFEFEGSEIPGGVVGYVEEAVQCGSGEKVRLGSDVILGIRFQMAAAHDDSGNVTVNIRELQGPGGAIVDGKQGCDFEGHVDWFLGMDEVSRFKVTRLEGPARLVVDIKQ